MVPDAEVPDIFRQLTIPQIFVPTCTYTCIYIFMYLKIQDEVLNAKVLNIFWHLAIAQIFGLFPAKAKSDGPDVGQIVCTHVILHI